MRLAIFPLAAVCAAALAGCTSTLQDRPISHNLLENLIVAPTTVYWLGGSFQGLAVTEALHDPSGAYSVQYGDCLRGGQSSCQAPLRVVSSPDNSFLPGGSSSARAGSSVRGVPAVLGAGGSTIVLSTGVIVVDIYAKDPRLAAAAARAIVPINAAGAPEGPLPPPLADSGFGETPLPSQLPSPLRPLG